jgi:flagellar motor switch protein FliN/FliY
MPVDAESEPVEDPSKPNSEQEGVSDEDAMDQAAFDAPLGDAGDSAPTHGTVDDNMAGTDASTPGQETPGGAVSQADIDVLLSAAGATSDASAEVGAEPAEKPDTRTDTLRHPFDEATAAMREALDEDRAATPAGETSSSSAAVASPTEAAIPAAPPSTEPFNLPDFSGATRSDIDPKRLTMLNDVNLRVKIELGRTQMLVEDVLKLDEGSVVELDKLAGDPVDVWVNDRLIARGEVLVLNDSFCVRISEVFSNDPHRVSA